MKGKASFWGGLAGLVVLVLLMAGWAQAEPIKWNCQSIFPSGQSLYKEFVAFTERVKVMTDGRLVITPHPVGAVVGYREMQDALRTGILQGYYSAPTFQTGKEPAFSLLCDLPGGYENVMQFDTWYYQKGGLELLREGQAKFDCFTVGSVFYGREVLPSKVPFRTMADFQGKKVRAPEGLTAALFKALGMSTVSLPGSELYSALDKGIIVAADWGTRSMNEMMGFHEVCKYSIEPGFHSMSALEFTVSKKAWDGLPKDIQAILLSVVREWSWSAVSRTLKEDVEAGPKLKKLGVEVISLPEADYRKIRHIARGLWEEWSKKSELSKKVYESHLAWCQELGLLDK